MDSLMKISAGSSIGFLACFTGSGKWFIAMIPYIGITAAAAGAIAWLVYALKS